MVVAAGHSKERATEPAPVVNTGERMNKQRRDGFIGAMVFHGGDSGGSVKMGGQASYANSTLA